MQRGLNSATPEDADRDSIIPGSLFADKYRILRTIGSGSTGAVYLCQHVGLDKLVALKVLHREMEQNSNFVERFKREAQAASRLEHPNSVRVLDFGQDRGGALYIVMEYIQGRDLLRVLEEDGPFTAERAVDVMSQILDALSVAHSLGIVHRDLKPENIVVRRVDVDGLAKEIVTVCDFGIAQLSPIRLHGQSHSELISVTDVGMVVGTPAYMSPEQARAESQDARSDVYSAGVVLFQLLTLTVPFSADTPLAVAVMHCSELPPRPSEFIAVNPALEEVCLKALSKAREARFQSARDMRVALQRALHATPPPENRRLTPLGWATARMLPAPAVAASRTEPGPPSLLPTERATVPDHEDLGKSRGLRPTLAQVTLFLALVCTIGIPMLVRSIGSSTPTAAGSLSDPPEHVVQPAAPAPSASADDERVASWGGSPTPSALPPGLQTRAQEGEENVGLEAPALPASGASRRSRRSSDRAEQNADARATSAVRASKAEPRNETALKLSSDGPAESGFDLSSKIEDDGLALPVSPAPVVENKPQAPHAEPEVSQPMAAAKIERSDFTTPAHPAVVAPAPAAVPERASVGIGAIVARAAVSKASVRNALNLDAITGCYRSGLRNGGAPSTSVTAQLDLTTNMTGSISSAAMNAPALSDGVRRCIEQVVRRGRVREVDTGEAQANVTLLFQPR